MTKEEYRQRSIDYLGLEEYICQLSTYQKKGKLRFRDQVKTVADILSWKIIFPALLAMVPFFYYASCGSVRNVATGGSRHCGLSRWISCSILSGIGSVSRRVS